MRQILLIFLLAFSLGVVMPSSLVRAVQQATFAGIAKYYDNRECAVTVSLDDLSPLGSSTPWQQALGMLASKHIFTTVGIITEPKGYNKTDWSLIQSFVNTGYVEAAAHSRTHVSVPYNLTANPDAYAWQIDGARQDIVGNLTLPAWWRLGNQQFVYAWIEPDGAADASSFSQMGLSHFVVSRDGIQDLYDPVNRIFITPTPPFGLGIASAENSDFDNTCASGGIWQISDHPAQLTTPWTPGSQADLHTTYISNRTNVWYAPLGLLYLYKWVERDVTVTSLQAAIDTPDFQINISHSDHLDYGASYPATYVFDLPVSWTSASAYYRYQSLLAWTPLPVRTLEDFFNGIQVVRFDFAAHKAYVSVGFSSSSDNIYIQLSGQPSQSIFQTSLTYLALIVLVPVLGFLFLKLRNKAKR